MFWVFWGSLSSAKKLSPPEKIIQDAHVKDIITTPLKENCDNYDAFTLSEINFTKFSSEGRIPNEETSIVTPT